MTPNFLSTNQPSTAAQSSHGETFLSGPSQGPSQGPEAADKPTNPFQKILAGLESGGTNREQILLESNAEKLEELGLPFVLAQPNINTGFEAPIKAVDSFANASVAPQTSMPVTHDFTDSVHQDSTHPATLSVEIVSAGHSSQLTSVLNVAALENQSRMPESAAITGQTSDSTPDPSGAEKLALGISDLNRTPDTDFLEINAKPQSALHRSLPLQTAVEAAPQNFGPSGTVTTPPSIIEYRSPTESVSEAPTNEPHYRVSVAVDPKSSIATEGSERLINPIVDNGNSIVGNGNATSVDMTTEFSQTPNQGSLNLITNTTLAHERENANPTPIDSYQRNTIPAATTPQAATPVNIIPSVLNTIRNQTNQNSVESPSLEDIALNSSSEHQESNRNNSADSISDLKSLDEDPQSIQSNRFSNPAESVNTPEGMPLETATSDLPTVAESNTPITPFATNEVKSSTSAASDLALSDLNPEIVAKPIISAIQRQLSEIRNGHLETADGGVRIQLDPKELGAVTVEVQTVDNVTKIQIVTDQPVAHAMLEKNIESLLQSLDQSDGKTFDVDVSQRDADHASQGNDERPRSTRKTLNAASATEEKDNPQSPDSPNAGGVNMVV